MAVWDTRLGEITSTLEPPRSDGGSLLDVVCYSRRVAAINESGVIFFWDLENPEKAIQTVALDDYQQMVCLNMYNYLHVYLDFICWVIMRLLRIYWQEVAALLILRWLQDCGVVEDNILFVRCLSTWHRFNVMTGVEVDSGNCKGMVIRKHSFVGRQLSLLEVLMRENLSRVSAVFCSCLVKVLNRYKESKLTKNIILIVSLQLLSQV